MGHYGTKNAAWLQLGICSKDFFKKILHNQRSQWVHQNYFSGVSEKNSHLEQLGILGS